MSGAGPDLRRADLVPELRRQCDAAGGAVRWCEARRIPQSQVSEALAGKKPVTDVMANAMGFALVERFVRVRAPPAPIKKKGSTVSPAEPG